MPEKHINKIDDRINDKDLTLGELLSWLELGCWTVVILAPFLYWANGPAVSIDQFVVRTGLIAIALIGGLAISFAKRVRFQNNK